jgi:hypothetical protein
VGFDGVSQAGRGPCPDKVVSTKKSPEAGPHVISYRATLDVSEQTVFLVSRWLAAHRKLHDRRP